MIHFETTLKLFHCFKEKMTTKKEFFGRLIVFVFKSRLRSNLILVQSLKVGRDFCPRV